MTEDNYSIVWKLENQLIIKPKIVLENKTQGIINEQRGEYLVHGKSCRQG